MKPPKAYTLVTTSPLATPKCEYCATIEMRQRPRPATHSVQATIWIGAFGHSTPPYNTCAEHLSVVTALLGKAKAPQQKPPPHRPAPRPSAQ